MADSIVTEIEREYITSLLESGRRTDGREITQFRDVKIHFNYVKKAEGSALVELGGTKVLAGVKVVLGTPYSDSPDEGVLTVGAELTPIASPSFDAGPPDPETIELSRVTDRLIRESKCIDTKKLCIIPGKKVWILFIDLYALDHDGNLFDASSLAVLAALATTRIPKVKILDDDEVEILEETEPLELHNYPVGVTVNKIGKYLVYDPNLKEENISDARLTVGFKDENTISCMQKGLSGVFTPAEILSVVKQAAKVANEQRSRFLELLSEFKNSQEK